MSEVAVIGIFFFEAAMIGVYSNALLRANSFLPLTELVLDFCLFNSLLARPILSARFCPELVDSNPFEKLINCLSGGDRLKVGLIFKLDWAFLFPSDSLALLGPS